MVQGVRLLAINDSDPQTTDYLIPRLASVARNDDGLGTQKVPRPCPHHPTNLLSRYCFTNTRVRPFWVIPKVFSVSEAAVPGSFGMSWRLKTTDDPEISTVP